MNYDLTVQITRQTTQEEREEIQRAQGYGFTAPRITTETVLSVRLTDEEWLAVKRAVLEVTTPPAKSPSAYVLAKQEGLAE